MTFVKSAKTSASTVNSRSGIDKMLRRYGATAISMQENIERREIVIGFIIPDSPDKTAPKVPVRLPISIYQIYDRLYGRPRRWNPMNGKPGEPQYITDAQCYNADRMAQAERVAWRNLHLWIDAALSAASVGLQTITEAFFAHAVVGAGGERMIEVIEQSQATLAPGVRALLTSEASST